MILIDRDRHSDFIVIKYWPSPEWLITMPRMADHDRHSDDHDQSPLAQQALDYFPITD